MRFAPWALAVACALVLFVGLGGYPLIDVREARDAVVARELATGGELVTPRLGNEPLFEKPVLAYAPDVAARFLGGDPVVRSRWLRALASTLLVMLTASIGAQHFGARAGWLSGLVLATSFGLPLAARTDGTQVLATLLGWLGCAALADATFGRSAGRDARLLVGYVALGLALLVAGPWPALWPLLGMALYGALARDGAAWRRQRIVFGAVLVLGVALPWYALMAARHGAEFLRHVPFFPYAAGERPSWYAGGLSIVSFLVIGAFPWCALLPSALHHAATWWRAPRSVPGHRGAPRAVAAAREPISRERQEECAAHLFIAALLAALLPIAFYPGAPLPAALPALPAAALLCARFLDHLIEDAARVARPFTRAALMAAVVGTALAAMASAASGRLPDSGVELRRIATLVFVASWLPFLACLLRRPRLGAAWFALPVAVGTPVVALRLLPSLGGFLSAEPIAAAMNARAPRLTPLVVLDPPPPSLRFYSAHPLVSADSVAGTLARARGADSTAWVAYRPQRRGIVTRAAGDGYEIVVRTPGLELARVSAPR